MARGCEVDSRPPQLMEDLARLLLSRGVDTDALSAGQRAQGAARESGPERKGHSRGPDRIPAEQGEEPGRACGQHLVVSLRSVGDEQPAQIAHALGEQFGEPVVAGAHGRDRERAVVTDRKDDRRNGIIDDGHLDLQLPDLLAAEDDCPGQGSGGGDAVSRGGVLGEDGRPVRPPPPGSRRLDVRGQPGRRTPAGHVVDRCEIAG